MDEESKKEMIETLEYCKGHEGDVCYWCLLDGGKCAIQAIIDMLKKDNI